MSQEKKCCDILSVKVQEWKYRISSMCESLKFITEECLINHSNQYNNRQYLEQFTFPYI